MKIEIANGGMTLETIAELAGGTLFADARKRKMTITGIATDSREVSEGTLFLGIRGERVDGNNFMETALAGGASAVLGERIPEGAPGVLVPDTVLALGRIATAVKTSHGLPTVAVTGSVGKTTTKEMLYAVLSQHYRVHATKGNFNSNIGLPMSVLEMPRESETAVFELGMSGMMEIDYLSKLIRPDIGIITNIGVSHMEALGSRENIAKAKLEILNGMNPGSTVLLNGDEPLLLSARREIEHRGIRPMYVSVEREVQPINPEADVIASNIRSKYLHTIFDLSFSGRTYRNLTLSVMGKHNVYAAAFAFAVGALSEVPEEKLRAGLLSFRAAPMRQSLAILGGVLVIEDCYNASPESMCAALDVAQTLAKESGNGRVMALLGDMRELGETSPDLHRNVGRYAAQKGVGELFTFGSESSAFLAAGAVDAGIPADRIHRHEDATGFESVGRMILDTMRAGDVLLVKASRALRAERVVSYLREHAVSP
ncbi:MAG: UDP-N-acetylmuramoyl-tripeptide--D-alanyl-D-alanine ligase [Clostridia bacterium]|nr:UDP-N-acetylmuramoyl-tripeptide--D-alanyl-D-alanine ligase [Clostridia bacterium]